MKDTERVFEIYSIEYPNYVIALSDGDCSNSTDVILVPGMESNQGQRWKVEGGTIESVHCKGMVVDISAATTGAKPNIQMYYKNDDWSQEWTFKSNNVILMKASDEDDYKKANSNQTWSPIFADPGFVFGLHPGMPGDSVQVDGKQCLSSALDRDLAKASMRICDESMSMLLGSELSVGTLKSITDLVSEKGPDRMPGYCVSSKWLNV